MELETDIEKFLCVICQEILTDPVTLPCFHTCCLNCLERTLDCNKYQCFLCRKFIGSWYRIAKRRNGLINQDLSSVIAKNLSNLIQRNLNREASGLSAAQFFKMSRPGEIKEEFDSFLQKIEGEKLAQQEKENKLSEDFIKLLEEEERQLKSEQDERAKCDELIARELASEMDADQCSANESIQIQLTTDEELARKLAFNEKLLVASNSPKLERNIQSPTAKKLTFVKPGSWSNKSKVISLKMDKMKRKIAASIKFGPMDRFVGSIVKK